MLFTLNNYFNHNAVFINHAKSFNPVLQQLLGKTPQSLPVVNDQISIITKTINNVPPATHCSAIDSIHTLTSHSFDALTTVPVLATQNIHVFNDSYYFTATYLRCLEAIARISWHHINNFIQTMPVSIEEFSSKYLFLYITSTLAIRLIAHFLNMYPEAVSEEMRRFLQNPKNKKFILFLAYIFFWTGKWWAIKMAGTCPYIHQYSEIYHMVIALGCCWLLDSLTTLYIPYANYNKIILTWIFNNMMKIWKFMIKK